MQAKKLFIASCIAFAAVCYAAQAPEDTGSSSGVFSGYIGESIWTLVWFTVLVVLLRMVAWKPLSAGLKSREEHIAGEISKAEQTNQLACQRLDEYEKKLLQVHQENKKLVEKQLEEAKRRSNEIIAQARKDAELTHLRAKEEIESSIKAARESLWHEAGDIVCTLGTEIFSRVITPQDNKKLIESAIEKFHHLEEEKV
jgi:F-type H+-transporting ATPase subunit b